MDDILTYVAQAREGNREAFGMLYDAHVQEVSRFLLAKTRHKERAQDLTSETFIKALHNIHRFSPKRDTSFRAWLFTIAHRTFIDSARKRHDISLEHAPEPIAPNSPTHEVDHVLLSETLMRALQQLSELQRDTLVLRIWHGYSFQEIAHILGKSESATKMLMKRGLVTLKTLVPPHLLVFALLLLMPVVRETP